MNTMLELEKDTLFLAWSEDRKSASPKPLQDWIARYPAHADDLIHWTAAHPTLEYAEQMPADPAGEARVRAIGRQVVAEMRARYEVRLSSFLTAAKARGLDTETLAEQLEMGETVVLKLERRLLRFASLPGQLIERLAETLQVSAAQVRDYLRQPPTLAAGASYKSDRVPQAAQQDFAQAIRACDEMTSEQKFAWLAAEIIGQDE